MKRFFLVIALLVLGYAGWTWLGVSPEKAVRKRLANLAKAASFNSREAPLARIANAQKLSMFCTPDVQVTVDAPRNSQRTISGRPELMELAAGVRSSLDGLRLEFLDVQVAAGSDKATVNLTARARVPGDREDYIQELKFTLVKVDGEWLISRIETVKTFSANRLNSTTS